MTPDTRKQEVSSLDHNHESSPVASPRQVDELLDFVQSLPDVEVALTEGPSTPILRALLEVNYQEDDEDELSRVEEDPSLEDSSQEPCAEQKQKVREAVHRQIRSGIAQKDDASSGTRLPGFTPADDGAPATLRGSPPQKPPLPPRL